MINTNDSSTLIVIGSGILLLMGVVLVIFVAYYQQRQLKRDLLQQKAMQELKDEMQRQMLESALEVQEVERIRIAKDLHDEVGAMLSVTKMSFNQLLRKLDNAEDLAVMGKQTRELLEQSIGQVRRISKELVPSTLEEFGLILSIDEFIQKVHLASTSEFSFSYEGINQKQRFDKKIELTIYRLIQELVNNALKHADASEISLKLGIQDKNIIFTFTDNGKGFDFNAVRNDPKRGLGLRNMESRLSVINGQIDIQSNIGSGTITKIEIPIA
ncbi:putative signal transduction histidine kinase [Emticicia oligotrophica DSM 17448]|uniref:histidine kinase n=1 Tax=Emticicia oligotrophica (strain DSM 17448 / CIP 109782 / MTCC 6937 / GPTSA100-15) TaxID=929562 RepID=A0ABM5N3H0_EMTOG|nr:MULTISPECIES: sensor histidine kinase [Emticicia]AFK03921.1 putative signal transduction histidine kinase [Emticicia oligotrophica DSM 17448]